jgi:membrane protein implicated in regulation of membrane protease activity
MENWLVWMILALLLAAGEIATTSFFLAPFAIGAAVAAALAAAGVGTFAEWAVFLVASLLVLTTLRPVARRHLRQAARLRTGTAALVGRMATVLDTVDAEHGTVRLDGEVWTARPYDEDDAYETGARVQVIEIRGATALVSE